MEDNKVLKEKFSVLENKVDLLEIYKSSLLRSPEQDLIAKITDKQLRTNNITRNH